MTKLYTSVVTQKGQVTIPVEIRRVLGIKANDRVTFIIDQDRVCIEPIAESIETIFGAIEPIQRPEDFQRLRDTAIEDYVGDIVRDTEPDDDVP
jgi:antitoxin PrlF